MKRRPGKARQTASLKKGVTHSELGGRRGRRSMPVVRQVRKAFLQSLRHVALLEKAIGHGELAQAMARTRKEAMSVRSRIKELVPQLKSARKSVAQIASRLRDVLKNESIKSRAIAQSRALAVYRSRLEGKLDQDLQKAISRFTATWQKKRIKSIKRKLAARLKSETAKSRVAVRKANAKAKASVKTAEALAKARARKAKARVRARLRKLKAGTKTKAKLVA